MGKNFKNINEELERMKTLMYETDNLILNNNNNKKYLNESVEGEEEGVSMDEQDKDFKTKRSSFKVAKVSDINTLVRGGASKFDTYKIKGTGVTQLFDANGKMTPEGIKMMKDSGLDLPSGQIVMRIGKKDDADTDKVFFQVIPATELSIVTKDKQIADLTAQDLDKLATEKTKVVPAPTPSPSPSPSPTPGKIPSDKELLYSEFSKFEKVLDTVDATKNFNNAGYTKYVGATYRVNKVNGDAYRITKDGIISAIFKKKGKELTKENFNLDLVFVNPLLFESVILEQTTGKNYEYQCVGDCAGQNIMSTKFTDVVDDSLAGKEWKGTDSPTPTPVESKPGTDESWKSFPCITNNSAIKKVTSEKMGIVYEDGGNFYYSNGRFQSKKTKTMGSFKCDGDKITVTEPAKGSEKTQDSTTQSTKTQVVTDADLMGETSILQNVLHSPWFIGSIIPVLTAVEFGTAGAATPLVAAAAGGSGALASAIDRTNRRAGVKGVVDALDGYVDADDLAFTLMVVKSLDNKFYYDDSLEQPQYISATQAFLDLYEEDEGSSLISDVESVGTRTLPVGSEKMKKRIIATINRQVAQVPPADLKQQATS